jgi:hypothetical protein
MRAVHRVVHRVVPRVLLDKVALVAPVKALARKEVLLERQVVKRSKPAMPTRPQAATL